MSASPPQANPPVDGYVITDKYGTVLLDTFAVGATVKTWPAGMCFEVGLDPRTAVQLAGRSAVLGTDPRAFKVRVYAYRRDSPESLSVHAGTMDVLEEIPYKTIQEQCVGQFERSDKEGTSYAMEVRLFDGHLDTHVKKYSKDGVLLSAWTDRDGATVGVMYHYYPDGMVKTATHYDRRGEIERIEHYGPRAYLHFTEKYVRRSGKRHMELYDCNGELCSTWRA